MIKIQCTYIRSLKIIYIAREISMTCLGNTPRASRNGKAYRFLVEYSVAMPLL